MNPTEVADPESRRMKEIVEDIIKAGGADVVMILEQLHQDLSLRIL